MRRIGTAAIAAGLYITLATGIAGRAGRPAGSDVPMREAAPAYTTAEAETALREVRPLVEEIVGAKVKKLPPIRVVTRKQYVAAVVNSVACSKPSRLTRASGRTDRGTDQIFADYVFGAYFPKRREILMLAGNFRPRIECAGVSHEYDKTILRMVVAHELTHNLQEQVIGEKTKATSTRSPATSNAVLEGHAKFVADRVAEKLGEAQAVTDYHKMIGAGLVMYADPKRSEANRKARADTRRVYLEGEQFIVWHYSRGGSDRIRSILRHPPAKWSQIEHPETYSVVRESK